MLNFVVYVYGLMILSVTERHSNTKVKFALHCTKKKEKRQVNPNTSNPCLLKLFFFSFRGRGTRVVLYKWDLNTIVVIKFKCRRSCSGGNLACVASVSVRFRSKERGTRV